MEKEVEQLESESLREIENTDNLEDLEKIRLELFGKKGKINDLMTGLRNLVNEQKREAGQRINNNKKEIEESLNRKKELLKQKELEMKVNSIPFIDISLPA